MKATLTQLCRTNHGYIRTKDFGRNRQLFSELKVWVEAGKVEKIKPGLYRNVAFPQKLEWEEVALIVPKGIFCLFSAWQIHELSTQIPSDFHLAVPHKLKMSLPEYPPIHLYHWTETYLKTGIEQKDGFLVYDREKSVCDAIRFRNKVGLDITAEVVKNYLKLKNRNMDKLLQYARELRVEKQLLNYLAVLI
jgi:predicted transcriptional regulator of viral defense system